MTVKCFSVHSAADIPPISKEIMGIKVSESYLGKAKTIDGSVIPTTARWCFDRNRWLFPQSGTVELVEYYTEIIKPI